MKRPRKRDDQERERVEQSRRCRDWLAWHRDERKAALAGPHGPMFERLLHIMKDLDLQGSKLLLAYVRGVPWASIDYQTRLVLLHEIGSAITALRERNGLPPFDDPLPGERGSVFLTIRKQLFPSDDGATWGEAQLDQ